MNLLTFVKKCTTPGFFECNKTVCLHGRGAIPLLFFSYLFKKIKNTISFSLETVNVTEIDLALIMAQLSTSFLGRTALYWLKNVSDLKPQKRKQLLDFLKQYNGPNSVAFFLDETARCMPNDFYLVIDVPERVDQKLFIKLAAFFDGDNIIGTDKVAVVFNKVKTINLDQVCLLLQYFRLAGRRANEFIECWMDKIVDSQHSLSELSMHFFSREPKLFFTLWKKIGQEYSPQFWISFWSEQVWRAYNFVQQSRKHQFLEAKRLSFRLPYHFTQRLWRDTNIPELRKAHEFLYSIDCSLKNGGSDFFLELFYTNFFEGQFC